MALSQIKYGAQLAAKIEPDVMAKFIANAEACKSTKDIVLRELVYAFNRYCEAEGGRFPVLQRLEIVAPGYIVNEDGRVDDKSTIVTTGTELGMDAPHRIKYPTAKKKTPHKSPESGAA